MNQDTGHLKNRIFFSSHTEKITWKKLKKKEEKKRKEGKPITKYELKAVCFCVFKTPTNTEQQSEAGPNFQEGNQKLIFCLPFAFESVS